MLNKISVFLKKDWIGILSFVLSVIAIAYTVILNEKGAISAKPEPQVSIADNMNFLVRPEGVVFVPKFDIYNSGKGVSKIGRMDLYLSHSEPNVESQRLLTAKSYIPSSSVNEFLYGSFQIRPDEIWSGQVVFKESLPEEKENQFANLNMEIYYYIQQQQLTKEGNSYIPYISDDLYNRLQKQYLQNIEWVKTGEYLMLLTIYDGGGNKNKVIFQQGYKCKIDDNLFKQICTVQLYSFRSTPNMNNTKFLSYSLQIPIKEISGEQQKVLISRYEMNIKK